MTGSRFCYSARPPCRIENFFRPTVRCAFPDRFLAVVFRPGMRSRFALHILRDHKRRNGPFPKRSSMKTICVHRRVASLVGAVALLVQMSPAFASDDNHDNRPVEITFTKWGVTAPPPPAPQPPF